MSDIGRGVAGSASTALAAFNAFFFALILAAPAVAWMAYLPVERRFGIVARSHVASVIAGTLLALLASLCFAMLSRFLHGWIVSGYRWEFYAPYAALVLVLVAMGVQLSARSSFSSQRAAGLAAAALTLFLLVELMKLS
ncbi:MAG: hypothetical protein KGR68_16655 [Betaproteobacteria bacterium]|nr:hypothetical protein [Betaproteobacteria bacterium]